MAAILIALLVSTANAGWWSDFCEKHLVADDPYQYEQVSINYLTTEIAALELKVTWQTATPSETKRYYILLAELKSRSEK